MTKPAPSVVDTLVRAAIALVPYGSESLGIIYADSRSRYAEKVARTVGEIASATGEDTLADRLRNDAEVEALFLAGLDAASRTGYENKRRLLAAVIAAAVLDDAKVEEGQLIVQALADLDAPHIRALERLRLAEDNHVGVQGIETPAYYTAQAEPTPVVAVLIRTGVVEPEGTVGAGQAINSVSTFGRALLASLRQESPTDR